MKKLANKVIIITLSVMLSMTTLLGCEKGALKVKNNYLHNANSIGYFVDGTVDLSKVTMTIEYSDGEKVEVENDKLTFEGADNLTQTAGKKTVTVKYDEPRCNKTLTKSFDVSVYDFKENSKYQADGYEAPYSVTKRKTYLEQDNEIEGSLTLDQKNYFVGDDNAFVFCPQLVLIGEKGEDILAERFLSNVSIYYGNDKLTATAVQGEKYVSDYSLNDITYVRVDYFNQKYYFTEDALEKTFKISVLPANNYEFDGGFATAVELTVDVVDGYNVYTAKEMSIMDNRAITNDDSDLTGHNEWDGIKAEVGVDGKSTKALVFQNDITITKADIPSEFVWKTGIEYRYEENGQVVPDENGGYFLYDWTELFVKVLGDDETFSIYGNTYNLDVHKIPTVCSLPEEDGKHRYYKENYSNANLFDFRMNTENSGAKAFIYDLNCIGNASRREIKSYGPTNQGELVNAGGFIFCKSNRVEVTLNNIREQEFFIGFFPSSSEVDKKSVMHINDCKAYDSFQNAVFTWGNTAVTVKNSQLKRTGGPVMIIQHLCDGTDYSKESTLFGTVTVDKTSVVESYVSGNEAWFVRMGATEVIPQITGLEALFNPIGKTILNSEGKMNLACLIMSNGNDTASTSKAYWVNGSVTFEGETDDKTVTLNRQDMLINLMTDPDYQARYKASAPMIKNNFAWLTTDYTAPYVKALDATGFTKFDSSAPDPTAAILYGSFSSVEKYIPFNMGGFGIVLGYYDKTNA